MFGYTNWHSPSSQIGKSYISSSSSNLGLGKLNWNSQPYSSPSSASDLSPSPKKKHQQQQQHQAPSGLAPVQFYQYWHTYPVDHGYEEPEPQGLEQGKPKKVKKRKKFFGPRRKRQSPVNIYATNQILKPPKMTIPEMVSLCMVKLLCSSKVTAALVTSK